jgi:hypothetical protein
MISDAIIEQKGRGTAEMAAIEPSERAETYPEPYTVTKGRLAPSSV